MPQFRRLTMKEAYLQLGLPEVHFKTPLPPVLVRLMRNNELPLESDLPDVHAFLDAAKRELASAPAGSTKKALKRRLATYKAVLSPIRRLPVEILGEIFVFAVANGFVRRITLSRGDGVYPLPVAPWRLGMVCRTWRATVLSYAKLWTTISLAHPTFATLSAFDKCVPVRAIRTQLDRSRDAPLELNVVWGDSATPAHYFTLLRTILERASGRIETLGLLWEEMLDERIAATFQPFVQRMPKLRSLDLAWAEQPDMVYPSIYAELTLPFAQLTSLSIILNVCADLCVLREAAATLTECMLSIRDWELDILEEQVQATDLIVLAQVRKLTLDVLEDSPALVFFLRVLVAPNLEHLDLRYTCPAFAEDFVKRSAAAGCRLLRLRVHLDIDGTNMADGKDAVTLMKHAPALRHLDAYVVLSDDGENVWDKEKQATIRGRSSAGAALKQLLEGLRCDHREGKAAGNVCPQLESIRIQLAMAKPLCYEGESSREDVSAHWTVSDIEELRGMVETRPGLKRVHIRVADGKVTPGMRDSFTGMREAGLAVQYLESEWADADI